MLGCKLSVLVLVAAAFVAYVAGHGMMLEPPNRSSMWRTFPDSPPNYNDNENFCGGFGIQWLVNNGACGLCGDDFRKERPRANENTGTYGEGKIAREYESGSVITAAIMITANHWGYFNFSVCPLVDRSMPEPGEECFQQLKLADGSWSYRLQSSEKGFYNVSLQLPTGLKCEQCVLRWWYHTGNTWGSCGDGTSDVGCGPQETFMSCSDIAIV